MRFFDFLIIGAQKAGTTAAAYNLSMHPEIAVFDGITEYGQRELEFFNQHWERGADWYLSHCPSGEIVGEKTAELLHRTSCHRRIAEVLPEAKLLIFLRDPVCRAYSQWLMAKFNKGDEPRTFEEAIYSEWQELSTSNYAERFYQCDDCRSCWREGYILKGFYSQQIRSILEHFSVGNICVLVSEVVRKRMDSEYNKIFSFLGTSPYHADFQERFVGRVQAEIPLAARQFLSEIYASHNRELFDLLGYVVDEWN